MAGEMNQEADSKDGMFIENSDSTFSNRMRVTSYKDEVLRECLIEIKTQVIQTGRLSG